MTPAEEKVLRFEMEKLRLQNIMMRKIGTREGFFQYYVQLLNDHKKAVNAFNELNELYHHYFDEYRYSDFDSFKKQYYRFLKEKR
jgi:hypothetical protein